MTPRELQEAIKSAAELASMSGNSVVKQVAQKLYIDLVKVQRLRALGVQNITPDMMMDKTDFRSGEVNAYTTILQYMQTNAYTPIQLYQYVEGLVNDRSSNQ